MTLDRDQHYLRGLVEELRKLPDETTWLEFKANNSDPDEIGEYLILPRFHRHPVKRLFSDPEESYENEQT